MNEARGDSARFVALYRAYETSPDITRKRIFLETMTDVLNRVERKVVVDESVEGVLPFLNLQGLAEVKGGK